MADLLEELSRYGDYLDEVEATWTSSSPTADLDVVRMHGHRRPGLFLLAAAVVVVCAVATLAVVSRSGNDPASIGTTSPVTPGGPCTPVQDHGGTVRGCVYTRDLNSGPKRATQLIATYGGFPVYESPPSGRVVGVQVPGFGFVPVELVTQLPMIENCASIVNEAAKAGEAAAVGADCHQLLERVGYSAAELGDDAGISP